MASSESCPELLLGASWRAGRERCRRQRSGVDDEDVQVGILCSFLPFLYAGVRIFFSVVCSPWQSWVDAASSGMRQTNRWGPSRREAGSSVEALVTMIEATAKQRHVDDSGSGERKPFASILLAGRASCG